MCSKHLLISLTLFLTMVRTFEIDVSTSSPKSVLGVQCENDILEPLFLDIAMKNERIDQLGEAVQQKDSELAELQIKYDQMQIKLAKAESLIGEKNHQIAQQIDLYNAQKSNSNIKDELLKAYRAQASKDNALIEQLLVEAKEQVQLLERCKVDINEKTQQSQTSKCEEQDQLLSSKDHHAEQLQVEIKEISHQRTSCELKLERKQLDLNDVQMELNKTQLKLQEFRNQIDGLQPTSCYWYGNSSEIHTIRAPGLSPFEVLCNSRLAGPGWTVVQRRVDGSENFYRNWTEYQDGFGQLRGEFFIGLEKLYRLTMMQGHELYIYLETFDGSTYYASYSDFSIGSRMEGYALKLLGTYTGNAGDGLLYSRNRKFSTYDVDNDKDKGHCAQERHGAWWYDRCGLSNLNGQYLKEPLTDAQGIIWLGSYTHCFKSVQMMIRPKWAKFN